MAGENISLDTTKKYLFNTGSHAIFDAGQGGTKGHTCRGSVRDICDINVNVHMCVHIHICA